MRLIAFDGDNTLWLPLGDVCLSDRTPTDDTGWPHFSYRLTADNPLIAERDDGARFALRPKAHSVLEELRRRSVLVGVVSYNHEGNVQRVLKLFGLRELVDYVVAEWHSNKDRMLLKMLREAEADGHTLRPADVLLVDDDPDGLYAGQCAALGVGFVRFGTDMRSLDEVLELRG
jgi:magnesium-dependent phosphatase-1